jgi:DNA-binding HxlR family transcriptional regulator
MPKPAATARSRAVRGSKTGRPIMALLDLLGRRWTLRIAWELREAGLVELLAGDGYRLTPLGRELMESFLPLHQFAERWSKRTAT